MNDMEDLSVQYIKLRQKREILSQQFKEADADLETQMAEIETQLLDTLNASNSNSMSTTAFGRPNKSAPRPSQTKESGT